MDKKWQKPYAFGSTTFAERSLPCWNQVLPETIRLVFAGFGTGDDAADVPAVCYYSSWSHPVSRPKDHYQDYLVDATLRQGRHVRFSPGFQSGSVGPDRPSQGFDPDGSWTGCRTSGSKWRSTTRRFCTKASMSTARVATAMRLGARTTQPRINTGHKWVVLAMVVRLPFTTRPWALPILAALARSKKEDDKENRRHKTTGDLARLLMRRLMDLFPERKFIFLGDGGYASHKLASFAANQRHQGRAALVSLFHGDAVLHKPPGKYSGNGAPRKKGDRLPTPEEMVQRRRGSKYTVKWYGNTEREVRLISDVGHWYKSGQGLVKVRWVHVHNLTGHRDDAYFYSTDPDMSPETIVELYTWRWNIEVMFQETKEHLGLETTRNWCKKSTLRTFPCLLGLYSIVTLIFLEHQRSGGQVSRATGPGYHREHITFSDALATVREILLLRLFEQPPEKVPCKKSKANQRNWIKHLITLLAQAI